MTQADSPATTPTETTITIDRLRPGQVAVIHRVDAEDNAEIARLKAMGLCAGRRVQLVQGGDPLIVRVVGTRLGVSARLAQSISVHAACCQDTPPTTQA